MQYYAVHRIHRRVHEGKRRSRVDQADAGIWLVYHHVYAAKNLLDPPIVNSPQVFIIVGTAKLASQMWDT